MVRATGLDSHFLSLSGKKIKELPPSSWRQAALVRAAFKLFESVTSYQIKRRGKSLSFLFGAGNRTRTCTLTQWNLRVMSP